MFKKSAFVVGVLAAVAVAVFLLGENDDPIDRLPDGGLTTQRSGPVPTRSASGPATIVSAATSAEGAKVRMPSAVRGRVVTIDGRPIEGATIEAFEFRSPINLDESLPIASARSVEDGSFEIGIPEGTDVVNLSADSPEYYPTTTLAVIVGTDDVVLTLRRGIRLFGSVCDTQGNPIRDATLSWRSMHSVVDRERGSTRTNATGDFVLTGVAADVYLDVGAKGYPSRLLALRSLDEDRRVDVVLSDGVTVKGRIVRRADGVGLPGANITAWRCEGSPNFQNVTLRRIQRLQHLETDADGRFQMSGLPISSPRVPMGIDDSHVGLWIETASCASIYLRLPETATATLDLGNIPLDAAGAVTGRVVDRSGQGIPNVRIGVVQPRVLRTFTDLQMSSDKWGKHSGFPASTRVTATTDADGTYRFDALPVQSENAKAILRVLPRITTTLMTQVVLVANEVVTAPDIVVDFDRSARFFGRVVDVRDGRAIAGVRIDVDDRTSCVTDARGDFDFAMFPEPMASVAFPIKTGYVVRPFPTTDRETTREKRFLVELEAAKTLSGMVIDADGKPISDVWIRVYDGRTRIEDVAGPQGIGSSSAHHAMLRSDARGQFVSRNLPGGPYMLYAVLVRPKPPNPVACAEGVTDGAFVTLRLAESLDRASKSPRILQVRSARTGGPLKLDALPLVTAPFGGVFTVRGLKEGEYEIMGFESSPITVSIRGSNRGTYVRTIPFPDVGDVEIIVPDVASLRGTLTGAASSSGTIQVDVVDRKDRVAVASSEVVNGSFEFFDLPLGSYDLELSLPEGCAIADERSTRFETLPANVVIDVVRR